MIDPPIVAESVRVAWAHGRLQFAVAADEIAGRRRRSRLAPSGQRAGARLRRIQKIERHKGREADVYQKASEWNGFAGYEARSLLLASWPLRIRCMISMPAIRMRAQRKVLNQSIGRVMRLMARRSCSTTLLRYFDWRISMGKPLSA